MTEFSSVAIQRAFKAMSDEAIQQAKGSSNNLATYIQRKSLRLPELVEVWPLELHKDRGFLSHQRQARFHTDSFLKSFQAAAQHSNFGAEKNLAQTNTDNSPCGLAIIR
jgi:hypothetical protein